MKIKTLPASTDVRPIEYARTLRHVRIPVDFSIDDILVPGCWGHLASKISAGDEVVAIRADMAWRVHLFATEVGIGLVEVHILHRWDNLMHAVVNAVETDTDLPAIPENYTVNHAPKTGWRVWSKVPALEVSRGHRTKRDAINAAIAHAEKASRVMA